MTVINPKSISGITSITLPSGGDNVLTIHTNDGTERFRVDSSGNVKVGSAATISPDGDVFFTGVTTATTFTGAHSGSGANLTSLPSAQLSGALPAISAASLTNVPAANVVGVHTSLTVTNATTTGTAVVGGGVTISESGIEASGIGITCANINGGQISGRRNIIINGAMQVAQRDTSAVTIPAGKTVTDVDRFGQWTKTGEGSWKSGQQVADAPDGFQYSRKITSLAANTITSNSYHSIRYAAEGFDVKQLNCGFSSAKTVTLSFYVKSSLTGTFGLNFTNAANTRSYPVSYTISSADTWEQKIITLTLDTSGTWPTTNAVGLEINWKLAMGSSYDVSSLNQWQNNWRFPENTVNILATNGATFQLTGVQLELGSQATAFEHRSMSEELALCERYCLTLCRGQQYIGTCMLYNSLTHTAAMVWKTTMRAAPTMVANSGGDYYITYRNSGQVTYNSLDGTSLVSENGGAIYTANGTGTAGHAGAIAGANANTLVLLTAEL